MLKYCGAFYENDYDRYCEYIDNVKNGKAKMHTGVLTPYDVIAPCFNWRFRRAVRRGTQRNGRNVERPRRFRQR